MLIGGFFSVDGELLLSSAEEKEFSLRLDDEGVYSKKVFTNNGRTASVQAMRHCREHMNGKKVLLPDYLCLSVISAFETAGTEYGFYRVKKNLEIDLDDLAEKIDENTGMIYVIHYFSVPQPPEVVERIKRLAVKHDLLIMEDITQALFSRHSERMGFGDYIVGSLRKWFPMTDGGILAVRDGVRGEDLPLADAYDESVYRELLISVLRLQYEMTPDRDKIKYLAYEKQANASRYQDLTPRAMTEASTCILRKTNLDELIRKRVENFRYLYEKLSKARVITLLSKWIGDGDDNVPFGLTILTEDREGLYRYLVDCGIIPEIQWILPVAYYKPGEDASFLSEHNLMLQCDQRYSEKDMQYIADTIIDYFK